MKRSEYRYVANSRQSHVETPQQILAHRTAESQRRFDVTAGIQIFPRHRDETHELEAGIAGIRVDQLRHSFPPFPPWFRGKRRLGRCGSP